MINYKRDGYFAVLASGIALAAATASAQQPQQAETAKSAIGRLLSSGGDNMTLIYIGVAALIGLVILAVVWVSVGRRTPADMVEGMYFEPEVESSKYEQLKAEVQGLYLRVQGGESKGYYRKIEQLARIFMERAGLSGACKMSVDEIGIALNGGTLPQKQAATLSSIFERCRQGAEHENQKLDFNAGELLKDLRNLIKQVEETPAQLPS